MDSADYTLDTLNQTLRTLHLLNSDSGGLVSRGTVYGVLGFVQIPPKLIPLRIQRL